MMMMMKVIKPQVPSLGGEKVEGEEDDEERMNHRENFFFLEGQNSGPASDTASAIKLHRQGRY